MRTLLLGGSGPIGRACLDWFESHRPPTVSRSRSSVPAVDVFDTNSVSELSSGDALVYLVTPRSDQLDAQMIHRHVDAFARWLDRAVAVNASSVTLVSSSAVYGVTDDPHPFSEDHALNPGSQYAELKCLLEDRLRAAPVSVGIVARVFNVFGPGCDEYLIDRIRTLRGPVWDTEQFGRDYLHVRDVAEALGALVTSAPAGFGVWNVGSGIPTSNRTLLQAVPHPVRDEISAKYPFPPSWSVADIARLVRLTGFAPSITATEYLQA